MTFKEDYPSLRGRPLTKEGVQEHCIEKMKVLETINKMDNLFRMGELTADLLAEYLIEELGL